MLKEHQQFKSKPVTFTIPENIKDDFHKKAKEMGLKKSQLVAQFMDDFNKKYENNNGLR